MSKAVVIYSGGMDSTVLLTQAKEQYGEVVALNFYYGSKHNVMEREAARKIANILVVDLHMVDLDFVAHLFKSDLLISGGEIPEGHYEAQSMKATIVPFRNGIMISIAAGYAQSIGADNVLIGSHAGDHAIYPDCRKTFNRPMADAVGQGTGMEVILIAPFEDIPKAAIVGIGIKIGAPLHLSYSCYKGGKRPCLQCGTDIERTEAFMENNIKDPALTEEEWVKAVNFFNNAKKDKNASS